MATQIIDETQVLSHEGLEKRILYNAANGKSAMRYLGQASLFYKMSRVLIAR